MTKFGKLNFVVAPTNAEQDDFSKAKATLLARLDEQLEAATLMLDGKPSQLTDRRKWYYKANGTMFLKLKVKNRPITFEGGENAIEVGADKNTPSVIQTVIELVNSGKFDDPISTHLEKVSKSKQA